MEHKGTYPYILLLALMSFADANWQSCPRITVNDLGSTMEFSTDGLVARSIAIVPLGNFNVTVVSPVPVRIRNFATVCDAAGDRINTSSHVSVVVEFQCNFQSNISSLTVCSDPSTIVTRQYQFQCIEQNGQSVWNTIVFGSNLFVQTLNPTATLSTPLVDQCRRCIDDHQSNTADPTTHCEPCSARIECNQGQRRCFISQELQGDVCCNFYLQNNCTDECPSGLVNDSSSVCVCPPLTLGNGIVSYSMEMGVERNVGSVATHTCISGYRLLMQDGGNTRTCNESGWSGQDFICDNGSTVQIVPAATVIAVFVLVGIILLILGFLVYTIKIKRKKLRSPHFEGCELNIYETREQGASDQILNEVVEHQDSRATNGTTLVYADIGPNAVSQVQNVAPDDSNYKVQYTAINYNTKAPQNLCMPIASMTRVVETDGNGNDYHAGARLEATEEDTCTETPKLPPKPQPQVK